MKILAKGMPEPSFLHEKQFKATLTGITRLKDGKYKARYKTGPGYAVTAKGELIVKPKEPKKPIAKKANEIQSQKKRSYSIAKQIVKNRMRAMVNMLQTSRERIRKPKLYFFTVSFKEGISDSMGYQVMNTWLTELRQQNLLLSYLWVAERQQNGTIHFHLAVPHYLKAPLANRIMKNILLDQKNKGQLQHWTRKEIMKYNGVDIAKNKQTRRPVNFASTRKGAALANYLSKYVTKNNTEMERLAWHCSRDWSALVLGMTFTRPELGRFVQRKMISLDSLETEYCEFFRWTDFKPPDKFARHLGEINYSVLHSVTGEPDKYLFQLN